MPIVRYTNEGCGAAKSETNRKTHLRKEGKFTLSPFPVRVMKMPKMPPCMPWVVTIQAELTLFQHRRDHNMGDVSLGLQLCIVFGACNVHGLTGAEAALSNKTRKGLLRTASKRVDYLQRRLRSTSSAQCRAKNHLSKSIHGHGRARAKQ